MSEEVKTLTEVEIGRLRAIRADLVQEVMQLQGRLASLPPALNPEDRRARAFERKKIQYNLAEKQATISRIKHQLKSANIDRAITNADLEKRLTRATRLLTDARNILAIHDPSPALQKVLVNITNFILEQGRWQQNKLGYSLPEQELA